MSSDPSTTEHSIAVDAPADDIYRVLSDVSQWPTIFPPTIHAEQAESITEHEERIRIWATANGEMRSWTSRRVLDPAARRIDFRVEVVKDPIASMGGTWIVEPSGGGALVRLLHDFRAVDDDPERLAWVQKAVDTNSTSELAALKETLETTVGARREQTFSFADSVTIDGAAEDVFEFIDRADLWTQRLPHVARVLLTEDEPGVQVLEMDTRAPDGSTHTTKSVRICFPRQRIVYKQIALPALMSLHAGEWRLEPDPARPGSVLATSHHTVRIARERIADVLGADADLAKARTLVRETLGANSKITLQHAKQFAESRAADSALSGSAASRRPGFVAGS
jgi:aromatase